MTAFIDKTMLFHCLQVAIQNVTKMQFSHQTMSKTTFIKELSVFASKIKMGEKGTAISK